MARPSRPTRRTPPDIRVFAMDVDGTLTDGAIVYGQDGQEWKAFHSRDGLGVKLLHLAGIAPAIISGRRSAIVRRRAAELGIRHVHQGVADKAGELRRLCGRLGLSLSQAAFVGDDLTDLAPMRLSGFSAAPADADPAVRKAATLVCTLPGGRGAVREAVEALLQRMGRWDDAFRAATRETAPEPRR